MTVPRTAPFLHDAGRSGSRDTAPAHAQRRSTGAIFARTVAAAILAAFAAATAGCASKAPPPPPPPTVKVAAPVFQTVHLWSDFTGRIEPIQSVELRPRVEGFVDAVHFTEGAHVRRGQTLYQIDPRPFRAEVNRLRGELARAQALARQAGLDGERAKREIAQNAISQSDFERRDAEAKSATASVTAARGALERAELDLSYTRVIAPIDGRISKTRITRGNLVTPASILTTIVSEDPVYASFVADEQAFLRFASAERGRRAPVYIGLANEKGFPHTGTLQFLDNAVDPGTGTIAARAILRNAGGRLTPGLFARVRLLAAEASPVALIAEGSLGADLDKRFVMVLGPKNRVQYRGVELGAFIGGLRIVKSGLSRGDVIVVSGAQRLKSGDLVKPVKVPPPTAPAELVQLLGAS